MSPVRSRLDRFATALAEGVIRWRWLVILLCLMATGAMLSAAPNIGIATDYRVFFSKENPELTAFEDFQATYTKNDNILFVLRPDSGDVFDVETLAAVETLTERAWQIPYSIRVDSITNFQSTRGEEDDLIVEDLVTDGAKLSFDEREQKRAIALAEPLLRDQLVTRDSVATAVNVILQYPQTSSEEVTEAVTLARQIREEIRAEHPSIAIELTGVSMLNNAFSESGKEDMATLIPVMYLLVLIACMIALRSIFATLGVLAVITLSVLVGVGGAGWMAVQFTPISFSAPTVIMTLAVADSIHILMSMRSGMRRGLEARAALIDAVRINFLAVTITSLTTIVGFLALNFSDTPPYWHLGNITAIGIAGAWAFSLTLLPALISFMPIRWQVGTSSDTAMRRFADWVIRRRTALLVTMSAATLALIAAIPTIEFNDQWVKYFDERIEFRTDSDRTLPFFGLYPIEFSVPAADTGGISEPDFLQRLEDFTDWLRERPEVRHVYSLADIMKRLNKNLHGDDESFYRLPEDRELSAQYLLLYELSLPFGLDLNDRIDVSKTQTRVTATLGDITTAETKAFLDASEAYIAANFPEGQRAKPTSAQVMFTYITDRNVQSMILGTSIAIAVISVIMMASLGSISLGLLSLVPNGLPILATFGAWALLIGQVGFSVATVASISLGIIVDDTVHFLTKYQRARREQGLGREDAVRYAFETVGVALVANTVILTIGFLVLTYSSFKPNFDLGLLTVLAIVFALILDFLLLPALLLIGGKREEAQSPLPQSA